MNHNGWIKALSAFALFFLYMVLCLLAIQIIDVIFHTNLGILFSTEEDNSKYCMLLLTLLSSLLVVRTLDSKWNLKEVGLFQFKDSIRSNIIFGLLLGSVLMLVFLLFNLLYGSVSIEKISLNPSQILMLIGLYILVAFSEEILFKGILQRYLNQSFNALISLIISSVIFALMHLWNPNISMIGFIHLIVAGLVLGGVYFITNNLWFSIAYHFSWNFFQSLVGFNVSGKSNYSVLKLTIQNEYLTNGGAFGAEGSLFMLLFQLLSIFLIWYFYKQRGFSIQKSLFGK